MIRARVQVESAGRSPMIHIRLDKHLVKMIDYLAIDWDTTRSGAVERLLQEALSKYNPNGQRDRYLRPLEGGDGDE